VISADAEFDRVNEAFNIIFNIDEGPYYKFGSVDIESKIPDIKYEEIKDSIKTRKGREFNARKIEETIVGLTEYLGDKGYAFVKINPEFEKNPEKNTMDLKYQIAEGPRVYVNKINIEGNTRTTDEVIRREFRIAEGDPYNSSKIKRSKQRVEALGYFSKVGIENQATSYQDKVDIDVSVAEQSTGELTFGAGFSSADGALADVGITERNLLGRGQYLKLNTTIAASRQQADFSFTEPYFLGYNFAAGIDLYKVKTEGDTATSNLAYDSDTLGAGLRGSYPLTEYLTHSVRYNYSDTKISNPDVDYLKHEAKFNYFTPVNDDWSEVILRVGAKGGIIEGQGGDKVRINDRFFIGGTTLRGFDNQGIGPRDKASKDPLGGTKYYSAGTELMFPLGLPEELQVKGALFADVGTLYDADENDPTLQIDDSKDLRSSVGAGIFWRSPVGPIRLDFAKTINEETFDEDESFRFSFGTKF